MPTTKGRFVWYDLMTSDRAAAESFYQAVVGWDAEDSGMPGMTYTLMKTGEVGIVGVMQMMDDMAAMGVPPHWTGFVAVEDVDATAEQMATDGATIRHPPTDIPGIGRFAAVADPQGAAINIFRGNSEPPGEAPYGTPGHVGWHELYTTDLDAALAFYSKHFGWTKHHTMDMGAMGVYQTFAKDGEQVGGMMKRPPDMPVSAWGYYFNVADIDAGVEKVKAGGGRILHGPMDVPGGRAVQCTDPQGAFFSLFAGA